MARATSTAKVPQNQARFAVLDDLEPLEAFADFAVQADSRWRIERRYRKRKDGAIVMYWNYRARKIERTDGRRIVPYRKGGKLLL